MLFLKLKLDTKEGTGIEGAHLHVFIEIIKKNYRKKRWNCRWEKMSKVLVENK